MNILIGILYVVEVIVCLLLAGVVMLQKPKEGGLGGLAGGGMGEAVFGADAGNVLIKTTIWLGSIFLVNTLILARLTSTAHSGSVMEEVKPAAPVQQQMPAMPAAPAPAAPAAKPAAPASAAPAKPAAAPAAPTAAKPAVPAPAAPAKPAAKPATPAPAAPAAAKPAAPAPAPAAPAKPAAPAPAPAKK